MWERGGSVVVSVVCVQVGPNVLEVQESTSGLYPGISPSLVLVGVQSCGCCIVKLPPPSPLTARQCIWLHEMATSPPSRRSLHSRTEIDFFTSQQLFFVSKMTRASFFILLICVVITLIGNGGSRPTWTSLIGMGPPP